MSAVGQTADCPYPGSGPNLTPPPSLGSIKVRHVAQLANRHLDLHAQVVAGIAKSGTRQGNGLGGVAGDRQIVGEGIAYPRHLGGHIDLKCLSFP
jgi:hypothetical protein